MTGDADRVSFYIKYDRQGPCESLIACILRLAAAPVAVGLSPVQFLLCLRSGKIALRGFQI